MARVIEWGELMIRILLAEDQAMVRGALGALLSLEADIEIVAEVARGDEVLAAALAAQPDVALLDIEMPGCDGLTAAAQMHAQLATCRVLILTTFGRPGYLRGRWRAVSSASCSKTLRRRNWRRPSGGRWRASAVVDPTLAVSALSDGLSPLTERERDVLAAAAHGASIAEIAASLYLSEGTVRNYLSVAMQKLGAHNRVEAAHLAEQKGWL